jgi:hypothetical protein
MSRQTRKGVFHKGECLNMLCMEKGPHYHKNNIINTYNVGPTYSYSSSNENANLTRKAMLNAYVGINEKRAKKENMKNAIKSYRSRNRKLAIQSLKNNNRRRHI